ncbi:MAG: hypothetical protein LLG03_12710 [Planctomycetaceae bacterium]|nr:hypothetical protein [Planctomycetaceae bacterium]
MADRLSEIVSPGTVLLLQIEFVFFFRSIGRVAIVAVAAVEEIEALCAGAKRSAVEAIPKGGMLSAEDVVGRLGGWVRTWEPVMIRVLGTADLANSALYLVAAAADGFGSFAHGVDDVDDVDEVDEVDG